MKEYILGLDVGTTQTGYCVCRSSDFRPVSVGKADNDRIYEIIDKADPDKCEVVFERFIATKNTGQTVIQSVVWYGKYLRECELRGLKVTEIFRWKVKRHLVGKVTKENGTADHQVRMALVRRFAPDEPNDGKGSKKEPGWFYGFSGSDMYAAYAVAVTGIDKEKGIADVKVQNR